MALNKLIAQYKLNLNEKQKAAVKAIDGPTLLLAVPGSGKTTVIITRIAYMIEYHHISPENILVLTFSKAAAEDMRQRFRETFHPIACPEFRTIHSFCNKLLTEYYANLNRPLPELEQFPQKILREILPGYPKDLFLREIMQSIGYAKNSMIAEQRLEEIRIEGVTSFRKLFFKYEQYKKDHKLMDYDDMLLGALQLLQKDKRLLHDYQNRYQYINVDEAQDTSLLQHEIIRLHASRDQNIFMVGDEDQSIYAFRAAYPQALLQFKSTYKDAKVLLIETNYRSTQEIIKPAARFIEQNKKRHGKKMSTPNPNGDTIQYEVFGDICEQYKYLLNASQSKPEGETLAIIYRNNVLAVPIIELFHEHNQDYFIRQDSTILSDFLDSTIISDITNLLKLAQNPRDYKSFESVYYKLGFYLNKETDLPKIRDAIAYDKTVKIPDIVGKLADEKKGKSAMKMKAFGSALLRIAKSKPVNAIGMVVDDLGYRAWMKYTKAEGGESVSGQMSRINSLRMIAQKLDTLEALFKHMERMRNYQLSENPNSETVLTTMHSSKGLEFDRVIITDVVADVIPAEPSSTMLDIMAQREEEVRLFFVAMTRAKKQLSVLSYRSILGEAVTPSVFIQQLTGAHTAKKARNHRTYENKNTHYNPFKRGDTVTHKAFGRGLVTEIDQGLITIRFKSATKKLDLYTCIDRGLIAHIKEETCNEKS